MVDLTFKDMRDNIASGTPDMLSRVADVARSAACNIYSKSPGAWLANEFPGTPLLDAHRALMDTLCDGVVPPPPPPPPPFVGGQCCGVPYAATINYRLFANDGFDQTYNTVRQFTGKLKKVDVEIRPGTTGPVVTLFMHTMQGATCNLFVEDVVASTDVNPRPGITVQCTLNSVTVVRQDGQPDTCGNLPGVYPPGNVTVNDYDYSTTINFSPSASVSVGVSVQPTIIYNDLRSSPSLTVNVGGIRVSASLGGFTFSPNITFGGGDKVPTQDPRPTPPPTYFPPPAPAPGGGGGDISDIRDDIEEIKDDLDELTKPKPPSPPPPPEQVAVSTLITANSGNLLLPSGTFKVTVDIIERPTQEKIQFGMLGEDVIYAGWCWFSTSGAMTDRMPVDADFKAYSPPERLADSFQFTLYKSYRATIRAYYIAS